jgi:hypothetical protein
MTPEELAEIEARAEKRICPTCQGAGYVEVPPVDPMYEQCICFHRRRVHGIHGNSVLGEGTCSECKCRAFRLIEARL